MRAILVAAAAGLATTLLGTPFAIRLFRSWGWGQRIREAWAGEGPEAHHGHLEKMGTPTVGGSVIILGLLVAYGASRIVLQELTAPALCVMGAMLGLGLLGFLDDFLKIRHQRSLGLNKTAKAIGQGVVGIGFGLAIINFAGGSHNLSFIRDSGIDLGIAFYLWTLVIMAAASNSVNLTDGLDGLASGSMAMVMAAYALIAFVQARHPTLYHVRDPLDLAVVSAGAMGATAGFLWWNAAPARIFMGDTGSLALGGLAGAMAVATRTQLLLVVLGGLYVLETTSVLAQVVAFRGFRRRLFRMAPIHHHFELIGWPEFTVIVRFWIVAGLAVAFGLGLFYADFLGR